MAQANIYPAIDVLHSISRVMIDIVPDGHQNDANRFRSLLATYEEARDLIDIGAYKKGSNPRIDEAITKNEPCQSFLRQGIYEKAPYEAIMHDLHSAIGAS
jgi:flagellum-specific ATP synthase